MSKIIDYKPSWLDNSIVTLPRGSAWAGLEKVIRPIMKDFQVKTGKAIEFGVEWGYSLGTLAQIFKSVKGVDHFRGDQFCTDVADYDKTCSYISQWSHVEIFKESYEEFFANHDLVKEKWDMAHIDIVHTYDATFECGKKTINRCGCVIFHDTESFPDVKRACLDLSEQMNMDFYNYPHCHGLGIIVSKKKSKHYQSQLI
jgi:hypothetical protein